MAVAVYADTMLSLELTGLALHFPKLGCNYICACFPYRNIFTHMEIIELITYYFTSNMPKVSPGVIPGVIFLCAHPHFL
jgi:hypothetical protein